MMIMAWIYGMAWHDMAWMVELVSALLPAQLD
jgi:hypothetical protein